MMNRLMLTILVVALLGTAAANSYTATVVGTLPFGVQVSVEQVAYEFLGVEVMYGATLKTNLWSEFILAPHVVIGKYGETSWWLEFTIPSTLSKHLGLKPAWLTFGYQFRFW